VTPTPLISIVIIFLDAERFLEEAIESVFAQTCRDWELLLVDDGSTDGGTAIAQRYASSWPDRVRYLEHEGHVNRGMSASRNLGFREARGRYVALLDADDVWLPGKLDHQVTLLEAHPDAAMVYGPAQWWYSWTGEAQDAARDFVHHLGVEPNQPIPPPALLLGLLRDEGISPCTCSMLIRREVLEQLGGFEERFRGMYEDQAFVAKLCLEHAVVASDECSYRYRQHPDSACAVAERTGARLDARTVFLDWLEGYLRERGLDDPRIWSALGAERRRSEQAASPGVRARIGRLVAAVPGLGPRPRSSAAPPSASKEVRDR
jgi:glycosyltransferase involved in cell wall biosynthesis